MNTFLRHQKPSVSEGVCTTQNAPETILDRKQVLQVFSSGGGTQSTAIAALIVQGKLPKPDFAVIANTGREIPTTWEYLEQVTMPALASVGVEMVRIPQAGFVSKFAEGEFHASGSLLLPAFSNQNGQPAKLPGYCSNEWKRRVVDRWLASVGVKRIDCRKWIGFSFDETTRILRMQNGDDYKAGLIWFPLVDGIPVRRHEAISIVRKMGWPTPPRSRCWMCPNQSDLEWAEVKENHPQLFQAAIALDESIRLRDPNAFLHSTIKPLADADLSKPDDLFSASCPSGECFL